MTKKAFDKIAAGLEAAIDFAEGHADPASYRVHAPAVDVGSLRMRLGLSLREFAARYGFEEDEVRAWEQATLHPEGAARAYLLVIARETEAVDRALDLPTKSAA